MKRALLKSALFGLLAAISLSTPAHAWWNKEWTQRTPLTVDTSTAVSEPVGSTPVLVRLHVNNFDFASAREDGGDLRFVAADDQTELPYQVEKYDSLIGEAFVWVRVPAVAPGAQTKLWLYHGNPIAAPSSVTGAWDADTILVYHFGEGSQPARDHSPAGNHAETGGLAVEGSLSGTGLFLNGSTPVRIPGTPSFAWPVSGPLTWSAWIKAAAPQENAVLFSRRDGSQAAFVVGVDQGAPYVAITDATGTTRSPSGDKLVPDRWHHLAVTAEGSRVTLYLDDASLATLNASLPALNGPAILGGDTQSGAIGFIGEVDELTIARTARSAGFLKLAALSQGGEAALVTLGQAEVSGSGHGSRLGEAMEHVSLFGDIANNMMFDGWIAVFVCIIMIIVGWSVAIAKFSYLNKIQKGSESFIKQWKEVSSDLTALDHNNAESVQSLGGTASAATQKLIRQSPHYHVYQIGSEEIRHRLTRKGGFAGLSARSIQAIKASLDSGLTHETDRLNRGLVYLTISIAGGPYVGLLGTVVGVMITFAVIAKTGEVEVNSIAPGIASALLATVAGLLVAIPALFIYSYLNTRIKSLTSSMRTFIDEFIAKMAEFYPSKGDVLRAAATTEEKE
ncbi:DUF2341 domain-containing protein [Geminisphaera colitermitum]|uniref:DUF2341 domain-containing protein n=1 Tax=Geminisphaera colitermitum TaxID=1148786 RepID=UPI000693BCDB|nr:MotA/TolQ/ExbB proton channel family protein [Geminisphaera colitermitum]